MRDVFPQCRTDYRGSRGPPFACRTIAAVLTGAANSVKKHADEISGHSKISENATFEANFAETVSRI